MKKYNLSRIMKRAWDLLKKGLKNTMSEALKRAWKVEKSQMKIAELKAKKEEKKAAKEAKNEITIVDWFVRKNFDAQCRFLQKVNKIVKETAKAVLLEVVVDYGYIQATETAWVPKSCIVK